MRLDAPATAMPSLSVVICTKDRPQELATCLRSVVAQTLAPCELVVVDASTVTDHAAVAEYRRAARDTTVSHVVARPGLPRQRNLGARLTHGDVVVFLDDDVVLEPDYLAAIALVFATDIDGTIGGVGGAQIPDPTPREGRIRRLATRIFLLGSYGHGIVKRSGRPEYLFAPEVRTEVELLSGCNMSYRRAVVDRFRFDERLGGYALGEDLRFSYRVSREWRLVLTPHARLEHRHRGGGRPEGDTYRAMAVLNRFLFFREEVARGPLDWLAYAWSCVGETLLIVRAPKERGLLGLLHGYGAILRHLAHRDVMAADSRSRSR